MPTTNTNFTSLITAIDAKARSLAETTTDPKDLVFLGKAVEALNVADTVSSVIEEGDTQVTAVNTAGTTQVAAVTAEGTTQVAAVQAAGGSYATQANVDALIGEIEVTVAASKFVIDGTSQKAVRLTPSVTYRFDTSDASNAGHPLKFSTTADGTHGSGTEFTTGVTTVGTAGSEGSYVQIVVEQDSPTLYYYCGNHAAMGGTAYSAYDVLSTTPADGQVLTYDATAAAYVNRASTGGGSNELNFIQEEVFYPLIDYQWNTTYASGLVRAGGVYGNTFGGIHLATSLSLANTAAHAWAVQISPTDGSISVTDAVADLWTNTSGAGTSTTYFQHIYGTGSVFYGGNNAWPGSSTHDFGYGAARLNTSGSWAHQTAQLSGNDHGENGFYLAPATDSDNGVMYTSGYPTGGNSTYRRVELTNGSLSFGSATNLGSTSTPTKKASISINREYTPTDNDAWGVIGYRDSSNPPGNHEYKIFNRTGTSYQYPASNDENSTILYLNDGQMLFYYGTLERHVLDAYNVRAHTPDPAPINLGAYSAPKHVTGNRFIASIANGNLGKGLAYFEVNPTTHEFTVLGAIKLPSLNFQYGSSYADLDVVFNSSSEPVYIVAQHRDTLSARISTFDWPFS